MKKILILTLLAGCVYGGTFTTEVVGETVLKEIIISPTPATASGLATETTARIAGDAANTTNTLDLAKTVGGWLTNSYVVVSGTLSNGVYSFQDMYEEHPYYSGLAWNTYWLLDVDGQDYTNNTAAYLPPYDGWYSNGVLSDVTVEFHSGPLADEETARIAADNLYGTLAHLAAFHPDCIDSVLLLSGKYPVIDSETTNAVWHDFSIKENDMTQTGMGYQPTATTYAGKECWSFDGADDYAQCDIDDITGYPFRIRSRAAFTNTTIGTIISLIDKAENDKQFYIGTSNGKLRTIMRNTAERHATSAEQYNDGTWYCVEGRFLAVDNQQLWVGTEWNNLELVASNVTDSTSFFTPDQVGMGANPDDVSVGQFYHGYIDEPAILAGAE